MNSKVAKENVSDLERIQIDLSPIIVNVMKLYAQRNVYEKFEDLDEDNIKSIRAYLASIRKDIDMDKTDTIINNMVQLQNRILEEKKYLTQIWRNYKNERISSYANLIKALTNIIDDGKLLDELGTLKTNIDKAEVGNDKEIDLVAEYVNKSKALIKTLSLDEETEEFVVNITSGEDVSLADVKESTMNWLKDHKLLARIKLVI